MTAPLRPPLTVLHIDTERGWRGGQRQVLWLAEQLARRGHRSLVAARPGEPLAVRAVERGLELVPSTPFAEVDPVAPVALRRVIRRERVDVVHAHTGHAVALAALASLRSGASMVLTRRVVFPLRRNLATRWKYGRADAVIAISRAVAAALVAGGMDPARITVVPSGVDLTRPTDSAPRDVVRALGVPDGAPLVVMVAMLAASKDPVTFVRSVAVAHQRVPSMHAVMVGEGPLRGEVERIAGELGLAGTLHLAGFREDADRFLAAADVAALSSKEEGLGTVLVDALALGTPVAATAAGGIPEVIEDDVSGLLCPPGDAVALGVNIARLLAEPALAARLSAGARARGRDFSIERTAALTEAVYARVLGRSAP
ncbi:MAG: glycosyltransferase [Gemmatimonadaceae bacterium]